MRQQSVFYLGDKKPKEIKKQNNSIVSVDRQSIIAKKIPNKNNNPKTSNEDLENIYIDKNEKVEKKNNNFIDELSMSESYISNINNSNNTFSTTNGLI